MFPSEHKSGVTCKFFKRGKNDYAAIAHAGSGDETHVKVTPQIIHEFPEQWDAYIAGLDMPAVAGTPLTEIPGFSQELERFYRAHGIAVCEQFAEATDSVCQKLGMGVHGFRKMAKLIVENNKSKGANANIDAIVAAKVAAAMAELESTTKAKPKGKAA